MIPALYIQPFKAQTPDPSISYILKRWSPSFRGITLSLRVDNTDVARRNRWWPRG
jgi:hypothetical protein